MAEILQIIIEGVDKATSVFNGINKSLGKVPPNTDAASESLMKFGTGAIQAGGQMTLGMSLPLAAFGTLAIKSASDASESLNKMQVVFGTSSDTIAAFTKNAAANLGLSTQKANEAAGTFGNMAIAMGLTTPEAADLSQGVLTLAADLASFNNISPEIALDKLRAGLIGESEPLRTLGVNLSEAEMKTKALAMGMVAANGEFTTAQKMQARYALILEQTKLAQGDFARTSDGMANGMRISAAAAESLVAEMGIKLLPIVLNVLRALNGLLSGLTSMSSGAQNTVLIVGALVMAIGPLTTIIGSVSTAVGFLLPLFAAIGTTLSAGAVPALGALVAAMGPVGIAIAAVVAAVGLLTIAWNNNWGDIQGKTAAAWAAIQPVLQGIYNTLSVFWTEISPKLQIVWAGITNAVTVAWAAIWALLQPAIAMFAAWWSQNWTTIQAIFQGVWTSFVGIVEIAWALFSGIIKIGLALLTGDWSGAWTAMQQMLQGVWDGIQKYTQGSWAVIVAIIRGAINSAIGFINSLLTAWNSIKLSIPGFDIDVPLVGRVVWAGFSVSPPQMPMIPLIPEMANGGLVTKAGLALVGENGPEYVSMPRGASVTPNGGGIDYNRLAAVIVAALAGQQIVLQVDGQRIAAVARTNLQARGAGGLGY